MIPIREPGKDPSNPTSYRPIALTSNLCKIIERRIREILSYELEKRGMLAGYLSGFRSGRSIMDSVVRLENEIRKAQANKESVNAVFLDKEKAYDMMWKEGLLIKLHKLGVGGRVFNWIFIWKENSSKDWIRHIKSVYGWKWYPGSVISPLLFVIMINYIFIKVPLDIRSLFADDGALWKRGRNMEHAVRKVQVALDKVVEWGYEWGCRFSVEKTQTDVFTRSRIQDGMKLRMYGTHLERVGTFQFLGALFYSRLTWADYITLHYMSFS